MPRRGTKRGYAGDENGFQEYDGEIDLDRERSASVESENAEEDDSTNIVDFSPNVKNMAFKMVRGVFALEFKKTLINKNQLQKIVWEGESFREIKFDQVFQACQNLLETVYGFQLIETPQKEVDSSRRKAGASSNAKKGFSSSQPKNYILVSILPKPEKDLLGRFWNKSTMKYHQQVDELRSAHENKNLPFNEQMLLSNGLTVIIISCVALSSNNMNKKELTNYLSKHFGLKLTSTVPKVYSNSEKITVDDFLRSLERNDYLHKRVEKNEEHEVVEYSLGRRAKVEFPVESLVEFISKMYGYETKDKIDELKQQVELSIGKAYG